MDSFIVIYIGAFILILLGASIFSLRANQIPLRPMLRRYVSSMLPATLLLLASAALYGILRPLLEEGALSWSAWAARLREDGAWWGIVFGLLSMQLWRKSAAHFSASAAPEHFN